MQPDDLVREYANYHEIPEEDVFFIAAERHHIPREQAYGAFCEYFARNEVAHWVVQFIRNQEEREF